MTLPKHFNYENANECRHNLVNSFVTYYKEKGSIEVKPLPIISKEDDSVIFIGAAICALKKDYVKPNHIPEEGLVIAQDSVRTRNSKRLLDETFSPNWGSYFTNIDSLYPYSRKIDAFEDVMEFFHDIVGISPSDLVLRANTNDKELAEIARRASETHHIEFDVHPEKYYRHKIGVNGIKGENFNFAIRHKQTGQYADIGNYIIFKDEKTNEPLFLEVGFGDTTILQLKYGLNNVLDCYPFPKNEYLDNNYKFKDSMITSLALCREGLEPSSKDEQSKILYKYMRALYYFTEKNNMRSEETARLLYRTEERVFGDVIAQPRISEILGQKEDRIKDLNNQTIIDLVRKQGNNK